MRHRLLRKVFDGEQYSRRKSRTISSTFTKSLGRIPHPTKNTKLHSKSTYFYKYGSYLVPSVCGLAFLVGLGVAINPTSNNVEQTYAESEVINSVSNDVAPKISLEVTPNPDDSTNNNVVPGEVAYFSNTVTVGGSNIRQYYLTLNTGAGDTGNLVGVANPYAIVGKVEAGASVAGFTENTWGYGISEVNMNTSTAKEKLAYNPVPSGNGDNNSGYLAFRANLTDGFIDKYKLVFAAKLGNNMPSDHYKANLYLSAVGNAEVIAEVGFTGAGQTIDTMQGMSADICNGAIDTEGQHRLIDERDGNIYWVSKLKDGKCWMTQNLDFDITNMLNDTTSNVVDDVWSNVEKIEKPQDWTSTGGAYKGYYDPGKHYYNGPSSSPHSLGTDCTTTSLASCYQFARVTASTQIENLHYEIGNYYSYSAATLGQMDGFVEGDATISICPKGWRLPTSDELQTLMTTYGWSSSNNSSGIIDKMNKNKGVYGAPLYFVFGGRVNDGQIKSAGSIAGYYAATNYASLETHAYFLSINSNKTLSVTLSGSSYTGYSIRCLAQ